MCSHRCLAPATQRRQRLARVASTIVLPQNVAPTSTRAAAHCGAPVSCPSAAVVRSKSSADGADGAADDDESSST